MDNTEAARRELVAEINSDPKTLADLYRAHPGDVWDTDGLTKDFKVHGFMAPFVVVTRLSDGVMGSLMFQHHPRVYYGFRKD